MKYTLLELTQSVLSSVGGDAVNSINDTTEAQQIVEILRSVYDSIIDRGQLPAHKTLFNLDSSGDLTKPVVMFKPSTISMIDWIRYNKITTSSPVALWGDISYLPIEQFIIMTNEFSTQDSNVRTMTLTSNGFSLIFYYKNDRGPLYYTSFDDNTIVFDSYDAAVDDTLQTSKSLCYGDITNTFTLLDTWTPNLTPEQFSVLLNEAKATAWTELKQVDNQKAEQYARRGWTVLQKERRAVPKFPNTQTVPNYRLNQPGPNFGRVRGGF